MPDSKNPGVKQEETQRVSFPCTNCGKTEFKIILKKDTMHRYICPECKTPTYVYITSNLDIIMFREDELCPECKGTGKCSNCNGTGKTICPKCGGDGYYQGIGLYHGCATCGGGGESVYAYKVTKGSGFVTCKKCIGSGVCPTCKGFRVILRSKG
ncbi:MAG: hypothetical protein QXN57_05090 [Desulfurococcaceae archaeon]